MDRQDYEFPVPQGQEYSPPRSEQEFTPPPAEFSSGWAASTGAAGRRRKKRFWLYAGAALLSAWILVEGTSVPPSPSTAPFPTAVEIRPTPDTGEVRPTSEVAETPAPTATPTAIPTASPVPEKPEIRAILISFSDRLEGELSFSGSESILQIRAKLFDPQIGEDIGDFDIPPDAIARGVFRLPMVPLYEIYERYYAAYEQAGSAWPDPELQITALIVNENGDEEEQTLTVPNRYELGWSAQYWAADADPDWGYPDSFAFSTYESEAPVSVTYSRDDPTERGAITVWLTINGRDVPPELVQLKPEEMTFDFLDVPVTYYYGNLVVPRPDWAGEHGIAHFTIREYLLGFDEIWVTERDVEY